MNIELAGLSANQVYFTLTQALVPRPIAWVLSENPVGGYNLAPFSYFTAVCSDPPLILLSIGNKSEGRPKDTCVNIEARREFVVHIPHRAQMEQVNDSSATLPAEESEVERLGLELAPFDGFRLPRLAQCRLAMACELYEIQKIGAAPQSLIFGRIKTLFVDDDVMVEDERGRSKIDASRLDPLSRLGAGEYLSFGSVMPLGRPR